MFDWDDANVDHIARHGISPEEAEEALLDRRRVGSSAYNVPGERGSAVIGATDGGRILSVVFTRRHGVFRVVTALDANQSECRRYRR